MHPLPIALALFASALPAALSPHEDSVPQVTLADRHIRVRDLAVLPPHQRTGPGALIAATVPAGQPYMELGAERRALLLRRRVPGQTLRPLLGGAIRFVVPGEGAMAEDGRAGRECFALRQNLAAGAYAAGGALAPTVCQRGTRAKLPLHYDRAAGAAIALQPLPAGTYLGPLATQRTNPVESGRAMTLAITEGPVRIERQVHTVQSGRTGGALFVRTSDGALLAAPLHVEEAGR